MSREKLFNEIREKSGGVNLDPTQDEQTLYAPEYGAALRTKVHYIPHTDMVQFVTVELFSGIPQSEASTNLDAAQEVMRIQLINGRSQNGMRRAWVTRRDGEDVNEEIVPRTVYDNIIPLSSKLAVLAR